MTTTDVLLPERAVLVHIGPHKTGTTTIQGALRHSRQALVPHGVVYAGRERQHLRAARALTGIRGQIGSPVATPRDWERLVRGVSRAADRRVVVSSEFFDDADDATARRVVADLGGPRVHVVVTLRPLAKIMPSAWQQYVRNRLRVSYDDWLHAMLNVAPYEKPTRTFWQRHRHDVLVDRWAAVNGPDSLTVVVVDDSQPLGLLRVFEQLLGLPDGLLVPEEGWTNRSLTRGEIELLRTMNMIIKEQDWPDEAYFDCVTNGLVRELQNHRVPDAGEERTTTPRWAAERAAEIGARAAEKIAASGVRIIGDIAALGSVPDSGIREDDEVLGELVLPLSAAASAAVGVAHGSGALLPPPPPPATVAEHKVQDVTAGQITGELVRRARRRARRLGRSTE